MNSDQPIPPPDSSVSMPSWYPDWAVHLAEQYFSGTSCFFVVHGNVHDLVRTQNAAGESRFQSLPDFLGEAVFGRWDLVLRHDVSNGLRALAGSESDRHRAMMETLTGWFGPFRKWSRSPDDILLTLDNLIERFLLSESADDRHSMAVVFEYGQYMIPPGDPVQISGRIASRLVRFLDWARNPYIRRLNIAFCLLCESTSQIHDRLTQSPFVSSIEVPMPDDAARAAFVDDRMPASLKSASEDGRSMKPDQLAKGSNGLSLVSIENLIARGSRRGLLNVDEFKRLKKSAIEAQCGGLVEFIEPKHTLDLVVGHKAGVQRLREDAQLISDGHSEAAPMGYLICGPVGTGKTFLAECYAGSIGIPCLKLQNFRSKYVGETEGNLQRVLTVLRSLGPVIVMIDEADAAMGDRNQEGDSGTSGRVFSMIASQMGDTRYRGRIIWLLMTCRPDLLPIDLKRQGRAEVHIPLFYPDNEEETRDMFRVMARKNNVTLDADKLNLDEQHHALSGADIESVVLAARRTALLDGRTEVSDDDLTFSLTQFIPSAQGIEKQMQEIAAVLECTQLNFLNREWREAVEKPGGRAALQQRLTQLRDMVEAL